MPSSVVALCNSALIKLGAETIMSLDDGTKTALLCKQRYESCRDYVLREHPWNCAIKRAVLAPENSTPLFGYAYQLSLPTDCLRVLSISLKEANYRVEGRKVLSDSDTLELEYVYRVEDPTLFDEHLAECIAHYLAYDISYALGQSTSKQESQFHIYQETLRRAKSIDAKENPAGRMKAELFINSRFGGATF